MVTDIPSINITASKKSNFDKLDFKNIQFNQFYGDHLFIATYKNEKWVSAEITPFKNLSLHPACAALHYGQAIFEGQKAYKSKETGKIFIFRPEMNAKRINISAERMSMPTIPKELFMEGLQQLLHIDRKWVPDEPETALYIRPYMFGSEGLLGMRPAKEYKFVIYTSPVGAYYAEPMKLKIENHYTRSAEGGAGFAKAAGNYAPALLPTTLAKEHGFHELLWTDAKEHKYIEESGTMNIFFQIEDKLITPSLKNGTTLAGITRDSVITIAKEENIDVEERLITVDEILTASKNNKLKDAFGAGTVASIAPVRSLTYDEQTFELPDAKERKLWNLFDKKLNDIKKGNIPDTHHWMLEI